jgi:hypothetical protein
MKRVVVIACIGLAAAFVLRRFVAGGGEGWEARLAKMPDTSPPKWMFSNIAAIRENTDKILERMDTPIAG